MKLECNIFKGVFDQDCSNVVTIGSVLKAIKSGRWEDDIKQLREAYAAKDKELVKKLKFALPAVTWSGVFEERLDDACVVYNNLMVIDIDTIGVNRLKRLKEELKDNPWIYAFFNGPTKGIKILVFIDSEYEWHNQSAFWSLEQEFLDLYNVSIDASGKNPSRLCFVSYDPDLYINPNAVYYHVVETTDPLDEFKALGTDRHYQNSVPVSNAKKIMDICVKMVSKSKTGSYHKGNRNNFVFSLSCLMCEYGVLPDQTLNLVAGRYQSLQNKEIRSTVGSAYKKAKHNFGTKVMTQRGNSNQNRLI